MTESPRGVTAFGDAPARPAADRDPVSLVIPGRDCAGTLAKCLRSVVPLWQRGELAEILFVDDGSLDDSAQIAAGFPGVRVLRGHGEGPGAARNLGWRGAQGRWVWFVDSDCVAQPDALEKLTAHVREPEVAGIGGSYGNLFPGSLLATLIHEEIVARHRRMPREVDFLATFNVIYRRDVLEEVGGFDESLKLAQDAELAYRVRRGGGRLLFEPSSRVGHHHPRNLARYLRTQARQGYYRMALYRRHPEKVGGDAYAGISDYLQPPLAMLTLLFLPGLLGPLAGMTNLAWLPIMSAALLLALQYPMTWAMWCGSRDLRVAAFPLMSFCRAFARGLGMTAGVLEAVVEAVRGGPVVDCRAAGETSWG